MVANDHSTVIECQLRRHCLCGDLTIFVVGKLMTPLFLFFVMSFLSFAIFCPHFFLSSPIYLLFSSVLDLCWSCSPFLLVAESPASSFSFHSSSFSWSCSPRLSALHQPPAWSFQQRHPADVAALPSSFSFHYSSLPAQHETINPQAGLLGDCVQLLLQFFPFFLSNLPVGLESILRRNLKQNNIGLVWLREEKETFITRREQILRCKIMRQAYLALLYVIATVLTFRHTAAAAAALPYHSERIWNMVYTQKIKDQV